MSPRTAVQVLRSWWLGGYEATVLDGRVKVRAPQPMSADLQASARERRGELVELLTTYCGGTWPPAPGSVIRSNEDRALFALEIPGVIVRGDAPAMKRRRAA